MQLAGEHNALNATAAAALAAGQGISKEAIATALASFKSVKRRLEVRDVIRGITIIDDFAHHPTAIRETLRALRSVYPDARLWAVLEPRSNTLRRKVLENDLVESLRLADRVILAGVYQQQRIPMQNASIPKMLSTRSMPRERPQNCILMQPKSSRASRRNSNPAMLSPSSPMAASTASMRNFLRGSEPARTDRESPP